MYLRWPVDLRRTGRGPAMDLRCTWALSRPARTQPRRPLRPLHADALWERGSAGTPGLSRRVSGAFLLPLRRASAGMSAGYGQALLDRHGKGVATWQDGSPAMRWAVPGRRPPSPHEDCPLVPPNGGAHRPASCSGNRRRSM
jgi:hypothetical protein